MALGNTINTVDITKSDLSSIRTLVQQLRVPELNYLHRFSSELLESSRGSPKKMSGSSELDDQVLAFRQLSSKETQPTLLKQIHLDTQNQALSVEINNIAFFIDRVFDVFLRKNNVDSEINFIIDKWRFPFLNIMYSAFKQAIREKKLALLEQALNPFNALINKIVCDHQGWSPNPKRSKNIVLDELRDITKELFSENSCPSDTISSLNDRCHVFSLKQEEKFSKVVDRMITLEERQSWLSYCQWFVVNFVNAFYLKHKMPLSLQNFIKHYWLNVLVQRVELTERQGRKYLQLEKEYELLSNKLVIAFCESGDKAFKLSGTILDELQELTFELNINVPEDVWMAMELSLLSQLKGEGEKKYVFEPVEISPNLTQIFGEPESMKGVDYINAEALPSIGSWFLIAHNDTEDVATKLVSKFDQSNVVLLSNYLGMKTAEFSFHVFASMLKTGAIKPLHQSVTFSEIFKSTVKGLLKVADTQQKSRIAAAEKAKSEAEALLAAKQHADELAKQKADEIAVRTELLLKKRSDKLLHNKEEETLSLLSRLNVGAWISIKNKDEKQRYKLVVKLAATGKFIFVDKLGIKKIQFYQTDFVNKIVNDEVEILSDGAEFEDSLKRVVSRLRMSK